MSDEAQAIPTGPRRGRPPSSGRTIAREPIREPIRGGGISVTGRDGQILTRRRTNTIDPFDVPAHLIEPGWEMQWIAHSIVGNKEIVMDTHLQMLENGWTPVPSDRPGFAGRYMPAGHTGHIIRGGQGLYERPKALGDEARAENERAARQLVRDRDAALMGGKANIRQAVEAAGFEMGGKYKGAGGDIRMSIDAALDAPKPSHQLAEPGE